MEPGTRTKPAVQSCGESDLKDNLPEKQRNPRVLTNRPDTARVLSGHRHTQAQLFCHLRHELCWHEGRGNLEQRGQTGSHLRWYQSGRIREGHSVSKGRGATGAQGRCNGTSVQGLSVSGSAGEAACRNLPSLNSHDNLVRSMSFSK